MKLTKLDKECFVTAVMADVPQIDYNELARKIVTADVISRLPKEVLVLWNDNTLKGFVKCDDYIYIFPKSAW